MNWSTRASPSLEQRLPNRHVIDLFVRAIENFVWGESYIGDGEEICSFAFSDLRHDGFLSLVYGEGVTDRPSCSDIYIVDRTNEGFELYFTAGGIGAASDVPRSIVDLRNDGTKEVLLDINFAEIPQRCVATWPAIYSWTGNNYTNVSDNFKEFYRARLQTVEKRIASLQAVPDSEGFSLRDKECLEAERASIQRFLGSSDAGLDQALRLAISKERGERECAAELLAFIRSPKGHEALAKLAKDADRTVVKYATNALSRSAAGPAQIAYPEFSTLN
jgi:hypothetical protein